MLLKSDAVHEAWAAAQRTVGIKLTIKEAEYDASDITSLTFDSGAMNGEALTLGSTYQNTIKVVFSRLIEGLALTDEITPELGIKLPDGTWDYTPLGVFVIDAEVQQDRNNNTTIISASDRMCMMGGTYESKLTYPAAINDIAVEIANLAAVKLNDDDFARLPTDKIASLGEVTYRDAIGFVAQFAGGFATFDRDGLLDIRQLADPNFEVAPSQYQSKGLTKNEALYRIGGIACTVTTTTKDDSGNETQDTKTLQSGSSAGTQITISNPGMTQDLLDGLYEQLQDLNFYPFSLSWFGDPNVEAGDWIEVQDTAGNTFKTPNLLYALTFSGGVMATSKADTTVSASANFVYKGQLNQVVNNIRRYLNASGHAVSEGIDEPTNPKAGDIWFKKDGPDTTIMTYVVDPETGIGSWSEGPSTKPDTKITDALQQAEADVAAAQKQADDAVAQALAAVNASGLATASAQAANDAATAAKQLATEVSDTMATVQSQAATAASDAATALDQAKSALATVNGVSGDYTTLKKIVDDTTATVSTLATQTSVDAINQTVTTTKALAEQTANGLTLKADTTVVDTINNTVKQQGLDLKAAQDQLALTLTASDLAKSLSGYATQTWASQQITATATGLEAKLSQTQTQLDGIRVGGTNLILNSSTQKVIKRPEDNPNYPSWAGRRIYSGLKNNETYTFSALATADSTDKSAEQWGIRIYQSSGDHVAVAKTLDANTGKRQSFTFTTPDNGISYDVWIYAGAMGQMYTPPDLKVVVTVSDYKLETGTMATDWSPAPEDLTTYTDQQVASLKMTVDGLSGTFAKQSDLNTATAKLDVTANGLSAIAAVTGTDGGKVTQVIADVDKIQTTMTGPNGITTRLQTLEGFQSTVTSDITNLQTQQTTLAGQFTSTIVAISSAGENLVVDGGFESGQTNGIPELYSDTLGNRPMPSGKYGAYMHLDSVTTDSDNVWFWTLPKPVLLKAGQSYAVSYDYSASGLAKNASDYLIDSSGNTLQNSAMQHAQHDLADSGVWKRFSCIYKPLVDTTVTWICFGFIASGNGEAWKVVDNIQIQQGTVATPYAPAPGEIGTSSQITQLQGLIDDRVMVDGKIAAALSLSADGGGTVLITGKSVHITGDTEIDYAVIKDSMIDTITADKIIAGTLNAGLINVIGMNASAITTGTITGANLAINLNTGQVVFQSGRIHDMANYVDVNIDPTGLNSYLSVADSHNRVLLKGGELQFIQPTLFDLQTTPYLSISNQGSGSNWAGATFIGRDSVVIANSANTGGSIISWELGQTSFAGLMAGKNSDGDWDPTIVGGANRGVVISGGTAFTGGVSTVSKTPFIHVGTDPTGMDDNGTRIMLYGQYVYSPSTYAHTMAGSANVIVASDGALIRTSSATKYKSNIERFRNTDMGEALLNLPQAHWYNKEDMQRYAEDPQHYSMPELDYGMIAEDLAAAGLEDLVVRGDDGQLEDIRYDRIAPALLPLLAKMKQEIEELKSAAKSA